MFYVLICTFNEQQHYFNCCSFFIAHTKLTLA